MLSNQHPPIRVTLSCEEMNIDESSTVEIPLFISIAVYYLLLSTRMSDEGKLGWLLVEESETNRVHLKYMSQLGWLEIGS